MLFVTMAAVLRLFDTVPECMIETLLIVHGSGDRNSIEFTQVCERWTCILAPWIRILANIRSDINYGVKVRARWNGKCYRRFINTDMLHDKGVYCNGTPNGVWYEWYSNGRIYVKGVYQNGKKDGGWWWWYDNGQLYKKGVHVNDEKDGEWHIWHENGQLCMRGVYVNDEKDGEWQMWQENGRPHLKCLYINGKHDGWSWWDVEDMLLAESDRGLFGYWIKK